MDGPFGAPSTGSLMSGDTATITEVIDKDGGKFVWGKLDRPDILVGGNFGEAFETQSMEQISIQPDVLPP